MALPSSTTTTAATTSSISRVSMESPPSPTPAITSLNQTLIPSLPNDISIEILARVPRSHHPSLSLVSKSFHSLLSSPLFFNTRSRINSTETSLFIAFRSYDADDDDNDFNDDIFTLHRGRLVPLPRIPGSYPESTYTTLGPYIYVLGGWLGRIDDFTDVWNFDCRFNKWTAGHRMHIAVHYPMAGVVDGKLYVIRGYGDGEVYDPDMGTWEAVESLEEETGMEEVPMMASAVIGRKIYGMTFAGGLVAYDVRTRAYEYVDDYNVITSSCCMINGTVYWYEFSGTIMGFDLEAGHNKEVRGIEGDMWCNAEDLKLVNFEGKLVVVWKRIMGENDGEVEGWEFRWMEIEVKKDENGELIGNVCFNEPIILNFPDARRYSLVHCLAVDF